jgi:hypothetical protein
MVLPGGRRDPQSIVRKLVGFCAGCGEEIYEGDDVIEIGDELIHETTVCAFDYCSHIGFSKVAGE